MNQNPTLSTSIFSINLSRVGIQLGERWQFWKNTHFPLSIAERIIASARGPCPCPREIAFSFLENRISSANLYRSAAGSVPVERTKIRGHVGEESLNTKERSAVWKGWSKVHNLIFERIGLEIRNDVRSNICIDFIEHIISWEFGSHALYPDFTTSKKYYDCDLRPVTCFGEAM